MTTWKSQFSKSFLLHPFKVLSKPLPWVLREKLAYFKYKYSVFYTACFLSKSCTEVIQNCFTLILAMNVLLFVLRLKIFVGCLL